MKKGDRISYTGKPGVIVDLDLTPGMIDIRLDSESFVRRAKRSDLSVVRSNPSHALARRNSSDSPSKEEWGELFSPHRPIGPMTIRALSQKVYSLTERELYESLKKAKSQAMKEDPKGEIWSRLLDRVTDTAQSHLPAPKPTVIETAKESAGFAALSTDALQAEKKRFGRQVKRETEADRVRQGTQSLDVVRKRGAAFYSRVDAPRISQDRIGYFGNPIDGTAYYLVVDNTAKVTGRWLTWEDLEVFREEGESDDVLSDYVDIAIEYAQQDGWQAPKKVKLIVQDDNREILFDRPSSYRFSSRPTIARPANTSIKTGGDTAVNLQTVYAEEGYGEEGEGVYGWYFYGSRIPVAHEILKRYFSPFGPTPGNRLYSFLSRGRTLLEEITSQTKAPISKSTAELLIRSGAAFCSTAQTEEYRQALLKKRRNRFTKKPVKKGLNGTITDPSKEIPAGTKIFFGLQDKRKSPFFSWIPSRDSLDFEILDAPTRSQKEEDFSLSGLAHVLRGFYSRLRSIKGIFDRIVDDRDIPETTLDSALDGLSRASADLARWFSQNAGASNPSSIAVMEFLLNQPNDVKKALLSIPLRAQELGLIELAERGDRIWYSGRMIEKDGKRTVIPPSLYLSDLIEESSKANDLWSSLFRGIQGYGNPFEGLIGLIKVKSPKKAQKIEELIEGKLEGDYFGLGGEETGRKAREARYRIISIIGKVTESDPELRDLVWAQSRVLDVIMNKGQDYGSTVEMTAAYLAKVYYQLSGYFLAGPLRDVAQIGSAQAFNTDPRMVGYSFSAASEPGLEISFVKQEGGIISAVEFRDSDGNPLAALIPKTELPRREKRIRRLSEEAGDLPLHRRRFKTHQEIESARLKIRKARLGSIPDEASEFRDLRSALPRSPGQTQAVTTGTRRVLWFEAQTDKGKFKILAAQPARPVVSALKSILLEGDEISDHFDLKSGMLKESTSLAAFPILLGAIDRRSVEVRRLGSSGMGSGRRGFSKNANVTVFKTYNPALFQITRLFWPSREGQRGEFGKGSTLPGIWSRSDLVRDVDTVGIYGRLIAFVQKTALNSKDSDTFDAKAAQKISEGVSLVSSGDPERIGTVLMDREGDYAELNLLWPAGVGPEMIGDVVSEMVMDPFVSLDRWRDAFQAIAQKMNFWSLRGLPRAKSVGTGSKILAEILSGQRIVSTKPSSSSEQSIREKSLSMIRSIDPSFPSKFTSSKEESEALKKFQSLRRLPTSGSYDRELISWLLDRLQKPEKAQAPLQQISSLDFQDREKNRYTFPPSSTIRQIEESARQAKLIESEIDRAIRLLDQMDKPSRSSMASREMIEASMRSRSTQKSEEGDS